MRLGENVNVESLKDAILLFLRMYCRDNTAGVEAEGMLNDMMAPEALLNTALLAGGDAAKIEKMRSRIKVAKRAIAGAGQAGF